MKNSTKSKDFFARYATGLALIVLIIALSSLTTKFLTFDNIFNVLRQVSTTGIIALGMTFVIICGGIDLSVGSVVAFTGTIACGFIEKGMPVFLALVIALASGAVFGLINGLFVSKLDMPAFIVTLATMSIIRGCAYIYSQGMPIRSINEQFNFIGNGYISVLPFPVLLFIIVFVLSFLILHQSKLGMYIFAVGGNKNAANYSGIRPAPIEISVFIISGVFSALSGIILAARMYSGQPTIGSGIEMDAIAAVVLGGTSFSGGSGTVFGTIIGSLIIGVMNNGLNILNVAFYYQLLIKGVIILLAIYMDKFRK